MNPPRTVNVLGYSLADLTLDRAAGWVLDRCAAGGSPALVVTLNPEIVVRAERDAQLRAALAAADLTVADGVGVVWAARRRGVTLPGRVPGVDLAARVLELGGPDLRVFLLGARPGVAERAAAEVERRFGASVAGTHHGYFGPDEAERVARLVRESGAQLLLAGLGEGQERFLHERRAELAVPVMIGVGGTLDVLAGEARRTPAWTRRLGVEWLWRVGGDPRRWRRAPRLLEFVRLVLLGPSGPGA